MADRTHPRDPRLSSPRVVRIVLVRVTHQFILYDSKSSRVKVVDNVSEFVSEHRSYCVLGQLCQIRSSCNHPPIERCPRIMPFGIPHVTTYLQASALHFLAEFLLNTEQMELVSRRNEIRFEDHPRRIFT